MAKKNTTSIATGKGVVRTSEGLRDTLFDALDGLNSGTVNAQEAQAICKVCAQIINSVNTEIEFYKHIGRHNEGEAVPRTVLALGAQAAQVAQH